MFHRILLGRRRAVCALALLALVGAACSSNAPAKGGPCTPASTPTVTLAAYSNVYDVYGKLISNFQNDWKDEHDGQSVQFLTSFGGSTTQAEAVVNGLDADVVALSLDPDVELIEKAGLITHDWQNDPGHSIVGTSDVVFDVRPGNPKHIENWSDLTQPGLQILTPDPAQSGGAKWNIVAAYGAAMRGKVPGYKANDPGDAERLLEGIFSNVTVLDKSANDSLKNFDSGNGDVAITYEYAALQAQAAGGQDQIVYPPSTVAIQTPTVVVDGNAATHCVTSVANAFAKYLHTADAQAVFASVGYERPIDVSKAQQGDGEKLPAIPDLFTTDQIGGWDQLDTDTVFGPDGAFTKAFKAAKG
ncbi:MAG: sulfate ABC transporter substrate-binding protein [Actinomycetota bacterium]|nr:sulfate ABC transporter substrate-binding protein [Actinomycetota bacterium]